MKFLFTFSLCVAVFVSNVARAADIVNYMIQPYDLLQVEVFQEPELSKQVRVEGDGTVVLPLINKVNVGKMTVVQAQKRIEELYEKDYLVSPNVNLLVVERVTSKVQVLGQVNRPGDVVIPPDRELTVVDAIAGASGFTRLAKDSEVILTRIAANGEKTTQSINVRKIMESDKQNEINIVLRDGDTLFVPERFL